MSQNMVALAQANAIRSARSVIKRRVLDGSMSISEALMREEVATMPIGDLLASQRSWGTIRSERLCRVIPVSPARQIGRLTERQRMVIARLLGEPLDDPKSSTEKAA